MHNTCLLLLFLLTITAHAQPAPTLTARWDGPRTAQIAWSDATPDACLWYQRRDAAGALLLGCGEAGVVTLGPGGDYMSLPASGGALTLRDEAAQQVMVQAVLPPHILVLPVVAR